MERSTVLPLAPPHGPREGAACCFTIKLVRLWRSPLYSNRLIVIALCLSGSLSADNTRKAPAAGATAPVIAARPVEAVAFKQHVAPVLAKVCAQCHNDTFASGGVNVAALTESESVRNQRNTWEKVVRQVRGGEM